MSNILDIEHLLGKLGLDSKMNGADFGTGPGQWALGMARYLMHGLVYAIDIQESYLLALEAKARHSYLNNIRFLRRDLSALRGSGLPDDSLDVVVMANVMFQVENREAVLSEAHRVLKPRGKLMVIDWNSSAPIRQGQNPVFPEQIRIMIDRLGFQIIDQFEPSDYYFGFIFKKS